MIPSSNRVEVLTATHACVCKLQNTEVRVICKGIRERERDRERDRQRHIERQRAVVLCKKVSGQSYRLDTEHRGVCYQQRLTERDLLYYVNKFLVKATGSVQNTEVCVISQGLE